ncbi:MAG: cysteine hydrolase [Deltaproteobacteria bacterium]|nr:cysteine hydrolase [Deltaproteobacteria bacterium]
MNPETTAVIWVDVDNEFLEEKGKLHGAVKEVLEKNRVVANMNELSRRAREAGVQVFFMPIQFSENYKEMGDDPDGIFKVVKDAGALKKGTWGAEVAQCLQVEDGDVVLGEKNTTCAFASTSLEEELRRRGVTHLALGGLLTNVCVESTMRTAYDKGFKVFSLTDCSATVSLSSHEAAVTHDWPLFSTPMTHSEFLGQLEA